MFIHNFKYSLKTLFKNKMLIFWTFAFPIILGTFFNMAFSNIENNEKLDIIPIAIVETSEFKNDEVFRETFKTLSDEENEDRLFDIEYASLSEAQELLENGEITGYLLLESEPKIVINQNGVDETIFKHVVDRVIETKDIVANTTTAMMKDKVESSLTSGLTVNYDRLNAEIMEEIGELLADDETGLEDITKGKLSYTMVEFYTLIAMTCLYGAILAVTSINQRLANMSANGKRVAISPVSKGKIVASSLLASYITQLIGITLLFLYTIFVLKVDYGTNLPLIVLLTLTGCLAGLSLGIAAGTLLKATEDLKTGVIIAFTMFGCFLSGMMGITMKYVVDKNVPLVNMINPANMITDGFYSLYHYDTLNRYWFNIASLLLFSLILIALSTVLLRRQRYDSI